MFVPLTKLEAADAKKINAPQISSGSPVRPNGTLSSNLLMNCVSCFWTNFEGNGPGEIELTLIPTGPNSQAA